MIFENWPVTNPTASRGVFGALGFGFSPNSINDEAACRIVAENIFVTPPVKAVSGTSSPAPSVTAAEALT